MSSDSVSPVPANTEEAMHDLQERLGRFARAVFVVTAVIGLASLAVHIVTGGHIPGVHVSLHELVHLAAVAGALATWLRCRRGPMTLRTLAVIDAAFTVSISVLYTLLGFTASPSLGVGFTVLLAMTYAVVGRSILVPSTFGKTLGISAAAAAPAIAYFVTDGDTSSADHSIFVMFATMWCVFAVFTAAANSRQLYGLRAKIREIGNDRFATASELRSALQGCTDAARYDATASRAWWREHRGAATPGTTPTAARTMAITVRGRNEPLGRA